MKMKEKRENLYRTCRQFYDKVGIVGLNFRLVSRLVSYRFTAFVTSVNYYVASLGVGKRPYRAKNSAAVVCSVAGIDIDVKRAEAEWAMIS